MKAVVASCCAWDKRSSPLSTPPRFQGEQDTAQDSTGVAGEEGLQKGLSQNQRSGAKPQVAGHFWKYRWVH